MTTADLRINGERLKETLETMAKIGATPGGGVQRLTLSDEPNPKGVVSTASWA
jgi:N-carbamoyl-L-amino-acid hydrolase